MNGLIDSIAENDLVVTRGRYKGQNVANLLNDESYLKWLCEQNDESSKGLLKHFKEQNPIVYSIVINNCIPKSESSTPEHNKLQNKFMNPELIDRFLKLYWSEPHRKVKVQDNSYSIMEALNVMLNPAGFHFHKFTARWEFETFYNWDVMIRDVNTVFCDDEGKEHSFTDLCNKLKGSTLIDKVETIILDNFRYTNYLIELKPVVGDNYPEILRKINTQAKNMYYTHVGRDKFGREYTVRKPIINYENSYNYWRKVLILSEYHSESTSFDELKQIYKNSGVNVYKFSDINYSNTVPITSSQHPLCSTSSPS